MEPMALTLLGVFSALFAMAFNYATPRVFANPRLQRYQGSYAGKTAITAGAVMVLLVLVSFVMSIAYRKPALPGA